MSDNFRGITFAEQAVTPSDDAIVRRAILPDGILTGCDISYSGSTLTMSSGYIIACGRVFQQVSAQNWAVVDATSGFARLVLTIDLTKTATETTFEQISTNIEYASAEDGFTALEQTDINLSGTRYQIMVCVVSLGAGGITGIVSKLEKSEVAAGLNFNMVGGLTQPTGPKENTIWVQTENRITSWIFSSAEPEKPAEGMVWVATGTSSPVAFSATKKNPIMVYPLTAYQRIGSEWAIAEGKIYQGGLWVELYADIIVYDFGATGIRLELTAAEDVGNYLALTLSTNGSSTAKSELLNISRQTKLEIEYSDLTGSGTFAGGIQAQVWDESGQVVAQTERSNAASGTLTLDISTLTGSYRVGVYANNTSGSYAGSCKVETIKVLMGSDVAMLAAKAAAYDILMEGVPE